MIQAATVKKRTALSDSAATASTSAPRKHAITEVPLSDRSVAIAVTTMSAAMPARRDALVGSAAVNSRPGTSKSTTLITLRLTTNAEISVTSPWYESRHAAAEKQMSPIRTACRRNGRRASPRQSRKAARLNAISCGPLPRAALSHRSSRSDRPHLSNFHDGGVASNSRRELSNIHLSYAFCV